MPLRTALLGAFLILTITPDLMAQGKMIYKGDTVNRIDQKGERHGKWVQTYPESENIRYIGTFRHGTPSDTFHYYYKDGGLKAVNVFKKDSRVTLNASFHPNRNLMAEGKYIEKKKDSIWRYYDKQGKLSATKNYDRGEQEGRTVIFFQDKDTARIEHYKDSTLHGAYKKFFENGTLKMKSRFEEGERVGVLERYHPNGQLHFKGSHKNGLRHEEWIYYGKEGNIDRRVIYEKGKVKKILGPDGELIQEGPPLDTSGVRPIDQEEPRDKPRLNKEDERGRRERHRRPDRRGP